MPNCYICKKPLVTGFIACEACAKANKPQTNFERMTASPEALAAVIVTLEGHDFTDQYCKDLEECIESEESDGKVCYENCKRCLLDWLAQPAGEAP